MLWTQLVELLQALIFSLAHVFNGSLGLAVCLISLVLRLALMPLTLRLARRALDHQRRVAALKPELDRLRKRYAKDPAAEWRETAALYQRRGLKTIDPAGLMMGLVQLPIFGTFYAALRRGVGAGVRFLWIRDLAAPNFGLTLLVSAIAAASVVASPSVEPSRRMVLLPMLLTAGTMVWILSSTSALFALSTGAGSLVNLLQGYLMRRGDRLGRR